MKRLRNFFDKFDRLLCRKLPGALRIRWSKLWIREDEFHPSLDFDRDYAVTLPIQKQAAYWGDLSNRRDIAHARSLR